MFTRWSRDISFYINVLHTTCRIELLVSCIPAIKLLSRLSKFIALIFGFCMNCTRSVALSYSAFFLGCCLVWVCLVERYPSRASPAKTKSEPAHCWELKAFPKYITENRIVKNLRVVVTIEHQSGPNVVTIDIVQMQNRRQEQSTILYMRDKGGKFDFKAILGSFGQF